MEEEKRIFDLFDGIPKSTRKNLVAGLAFLGSACLAYEEHQKAQEEQRRQNEELRAIRETLEEIQKEQRLQNEGIQREREAWAAEREAYKEQLSALRQEGIEKEQALQKTEADLKAERHSSGTLQRRLMELEAAQQAERARIEQERLTERTQMEQERQAEREALRRETAESLAEAQKEYREIQPEWDLYHRYKKWIAENESRIHLNRLDCGSFTTFISSCARRAMLPYLFQELDSALLWDWEPGSFAVLDEVINLCCTLQGLERTEPSGLYDSAFQRKREDAPAGGPIAGVLLRGVSQNGMPWEACKSFVELGGN